jgi:hypothetical protein
MRVRHMLHETTSRLALAALQKADAAVGRLTFSATIIESYRRPTLPAMVKACAASLP